ncbi:hypothetical protein [Janibacter melonis]|nr:hypothetical protein [Janibacter melonis]
MKRTVIAFMLAVAALVGGVAAASSATADDASTAKSKILRGIDWG